MNVGALIERILGIGVVMAAEELRDVKPPVGEEVALLRWGLIALIVAGILILMFVLLRWLRRPRSKEGVVISPWDKALKELEFLQRENLPQRKEAGLFYSRLSGIIRRYIEERFAIRAPEMTTDEFLQAIQDRDVFDQEQKNLLKQFLTGSDMAKFARYAASEIEMQQHYDLAVNFVKRAQFEPTAHSQQATDNTNTKS